MIKIVVADDHAIVRSGLRLILSEESDMYVAAEASSVSELMRLLRAEQFDVAVLDITMPDRNGLEALQEIRERHPRLPVLILTMHPEDQLAARALQAGAAGYVTKAGAPGELVKAIRKVCSGGTYVSEDAAEKLARVLRGDRRLPHEQLSEREFQVLLLLASGNTLSGSASHLSLSVRTVSTYRARILSKMGLKSNAELTSYAIKNGLV